MDEPEDVAVSKLLMSGSEGGWVFGGNIRVSDIHPEPPTTHNLAVDTPIFPFVVELSGPDQSYTLRLGCDDDNIRQNWIDEITKAMHIQHYLYSCVECGAVPSKSVFCSALAGQTSVILENINMSIPTLGSLVMVCKLNQSHGAVLQALHLENAQLGDLHVPLLTSLLTFSPHLQSLSLANNYITCQGTKELSEMLVNCSRLILLDLSSNFIADEGVGALSMALAKTTQLSHLDLSRNRITEHGIKLLALGIGGFDSFITSMNLSYNQLGNSAAALTALLLTNESPKIENVDLSYCGIQSTGLKELAQALIGCKSLRNLVLTGNHGDDISVALLMDALSLHQRKFGISAPLESFGSDGQSIAFKREILNPDKSALTLHLGGLVLEDPPVTLQLKTMRHAMAYACQQSSIPRASLVRRVAPITSVDMDTGTSKSNEPSQSPKQLDTSDMGAIEPENADVHKNFIKPSSWICFRIQLVPYMDGIYDVLEGLARALKADPRQLQLLSCTDMDEIDSCFVIVAPMEPEDESIQKALSQVSRHMQKSATRSKIMAHSHKRPVLEKQPTSAPELPTADQILVTLRELASTSSPLLRKIGVRTVFIQQHKANFKKSLTFHCHIKGGGSGGDDILSEYIPPLFPMASVLDNIDESADEEDPEDAMRESDLATGRVRSGAMRAISHSEDDAVRRDSMWYHEDDEEDEDANGNGEWKDAMGNNDDEIGDAMVFDSMALQDVTENIDSKIVLAIRKLQQSSEIPMDSGAFWQQAFGGSGDMLIEVTEDALDEDGLFHNVGIRKHVCDAMLQRDTEKLSRYVEYMKANGVIGGMALQMGEQLLSEIAALHRDAGNLESLAQKPEDINIVETFLMTCGRIGYSGKETIMAVELREYLVRWALQEDPEYYKELDGIKQRSLVTNIMISRDLTQLRATLESQDASMLPREQRQIATQLLDDCDAAKQKLLSALETGSLEQLEDCIAEAAYLNIYDDDVDRAVEVMLDIGGNVGSLLSEFLDSLRAGSKGDLDSALSEARRVGWDHHFIHESSLKILDERNRVVQEEIAKNKILAMSNDIKQGYEVKNIEVMQLLRGVASMGLNQNPGLQPHIQLLEKHMKRMAGLASQEEEILKLIDEKNLDKLNEVLSGRGTGRLVMCAPTAEAMREWIDILKIGCNMGMDESGNEYEVYKVGVLEKAARGKEGALRNWRQRYFVLDKLSISYYTKAGGEKKGNVRVGGGAVRELRDEDTGGRNFCFELQEGRDLSSIDPDLLFEARRQVKIMQQDNLEEILAVAVASQSEDDCSAILDKATGLDIELNHELVSQAKMILLRMQHRMLKVELHHACQSIPRGHLQELLRSAKRSRLDPSFPMFKKAQLLCEKPESELSILRSRGCLLNLDESVFTRSLASVQRFDVKRLGSREKTVLVAALLQHCGMQMVRSILFEGEIPNNAAKVIQQTLDGCMQYFVESEPMQLARNIILSYPLDGTSASDAAASHNHGSGPLVQLKRMHSKLDAAGMGSSDAAARGTGGLFMLHKYPNIRPIETPTRTSFLSRRKTTGLDASSFMAHTLDPIQSSILVLQKNEAEIAVEMFLVLLVAMGDKPAQSIGSSRVFSNSSDPNKLALELINLGVTVSPMRDELYIQVCKQLTRNPKESSRMKGWTLLSTYFHCFPPSSDFFPYVRSFLTQCLQDNMVGAATKRGYMSDTDECGGKFNRLTQYAIISSKWCEKESSLESGFRSDVSMCDVALMKDILNFTPINVEVAMMTGSVHTLKLCFGDIDTSFSLIRLLVEEILGAGYSEASTTKSLPDGCLLPYEKPSQRPPVRPTIERTVSSIVANKSVTPQMDLIIKLFRGFWLYESDSGGGFFDAQSIPVQPDEAMVLQWQHDFLWDLMQNHATSNRQLVLRRRLLLCSEDLFDQIEVFRDMAVERDNLGTKRLWSTWLRDEGNGLPIDHVRIDLLFAEESRYVNSRLYAMSEDAHIYLAALQMTLSWSERTQSILWGGGLEDIMHNIDSSVRPSMKRSSYEAPTPAAAVVSKNAKKRHSLMSAKGELEAGPHRESVVSLLRGRAGSAAAYEETNASDDDDDDEDEDDISSANPSWAGDMISGDDLSEDDILFFEEKLSVLGIVHTPELIVDIANNMYYFHQMAQQMNVSIFSQRFKYMVKIAYLTYVMAWPLAGGHFAEALFDKTENGENLINVLVCVSGNGIHLLNAEDWSLIFHAPLYDIQSCTLLSASAYPDASMEAQLLRIVVNEMPLLLVSSSARDVQQLLEAFNTEMLSAGSFPHGVEGGNDILDIGESFTQSSEMKAVMHRFVKNFPMFPTPPVPLPLSLSNLYFDPPKSRRAILAEERAEEERIEQEQARLAAETHAAKNMAHLEHGKQTLQNFMTDDDDDDDEKLETSSQGGKVKSRRRKRNTLLHMRENIEQQLPMMINSAVCGISNRPPLVKMDIPPPPVRGHGLRIDTMFNSDALEKPPLLSADASPPEEPPSVPVDIYRPQPAPLRNIQYPISVEWADQDVRREEENEFDGAMEFCWLRGQEYGEERDDASFNVINYYSSSLGYSVQPVAESGDDFQERATSVCLYSRQSEDDQSEGGNMSQSMSSQGSRQDDFEGLVEQKRSDDDEDELSDPPPEE